MIDTLKKLFGIGPAVDYKQLVTEGAIILDVRSKGEFSQGHIKGSVNLPLDQISNKLKTLKDKNKPIITCCASGMRSASAKGILKSNGFQTVHNGGGWMSLNNKIK
jgi:rhodanese-related sulfurtransferase